MLSGLYSYCISKYIVIISKRNFILDNLSIFIRYLKITKLVSLYAGVSGQLDHSKLLYNHHFRYTFDHLIFGTSTRRHDSKSLTTIKKHKRQHSSTMPRCPHCSIPQMKFALIFVISANLIFILVKICGKTFEYHNADTTYLNIMMSN